MLFVRTASEPYPIAEDAFETLYNKVCVPDESDKVKLVINGDESEEYSISSEDGKLVIEGGRKRALLYGVYDYFSRFFGVSYYWDGDRYPKNKKKLVLPTEKYTSSPSYELRGIRYFAHRGLTRFQAEMWGSDDWKKEIDYLVKRRFNMFMLRMGNEDVFQRTFPDICPYPENDGPIDSGRHGFDDRTSAWGLKYRGELIRKIYAYALERDLIIPVDCGTMTHWYSRTPKEYIDAVDPKPLVQSTSLYGDRCGLVWDVRDEKYLRDYFRLTETMVRDSGQSLYFHTIGLAERLFSDDRQKNLELKTEVYRAIASYLKKNYPSAKLLISSWDLAMYWKPEEVRKLLAELDEEQCILFDYTSESRDDVNNFTSWVGRGGFPYVFGIFHAYEPNNEIRGDYERIEERKACILGDKACRGFILWPELSHGDGVMLEYVCENAWKGDVKREAVLDAYCRRRYGDSEKMRSLYEKLYPVSRLFAWGFCSRHPERDVFRNYYPDLAPSDFGYSPVFGELSDFQKKRIEFYLPQYDEVKGNIPDVISGAAALYDGSDEQGKRDLCDIIRTAVARWLHFEIMRLQTKQDDFALMEKIYSVFTLFACLLEANDDYSLCRSFERLKNESAVNPYFETTLKENTLTDYCLTDVAEIIRFYSLPVSRLTFDFLEGKIGEEDYSSEVKKVKERFMATKIREMRAESPRKVAEIAEKIVKIIK